MAEVKSNGVKSFDLEALRVSVTSSSTLLRKAELHALEDQLTYTGKRPPRRRVRYASNRQLIKRLRDQRSLCGATPQHSIQHLSIIP